MSKSQGLLTEAKVFREKNTGYNETPREKEAMNTFTVPANRLKKNDLIEIDGALARVLYTFEYRGCMKTEIIATLELGIQEIELPVRQPVTVHDV